MNQTNSKDQNNTIATVTKILLIALLVIAVVVVIVSALKSLGVFGRLNTAVSSDNYSISENSLCLYKYQTAQQEYYTMWLYDAYGMTQYGLQQTYGDVNTFINAMIYNTTVSNPHTFDEDAYSQAESILTYCEAAREAGIKLEDEDKASVDEYIDNLKAMADANGVKMKQYLTSWVGSGVSVKDCRKALELNVLASKYAEILNKDMTAAVTDEEVEKYRSENMGTFYSTKFTSYSLPNETLIDKAKACTSVDEIKAMIVDYYMDQKFDSNYKSLITDKNVETTATAEETKADVLATVKYWAKMTEEAGKFDKTSEDDAYVAAGYSIATAIYTEIQSQFGRINGNGSSSYADPNGENATELQKWLFADGRKAGDSNVISITTQTTNTDGTAGSTTSNTWYLVGEDVMSLDTDKTRSAYYAVLAGDAEGTENAKTADQKYSEFESGEHTGENFEKIFAATLNESLSESSLPDELAEWLFSADRKENDYARLTAKNTGSDGKETETEYVMYYVTENEENWKVSAKSNIVSDRIDTWFEETKAKYHVISDYEPETAAATTAA
ncbi:MAG: hypothetical protein MJ192_10770 [Clostridia bacterium]|nr:hypothetical protein [Clostridia bacterium]